MHIIVCIKSVIVEAPKGKIVRTPDKCAFNPFDRPALEAALQLKADHGGTVSVLSMGPPSAETSLREAMAAGADRAVLLCDPALAGADTLATATTLCAGINHLAPFDLLLFGSRTADSDTGPHDMGSFASRGTHRMGNAVIRASEEARQVMLEAAAGELEVDARHLVALPSQAGRQQGQAVLGAEKAPEGGDGVVDEHQVLAQPLHQSRVGIVRQHFQCQLHAGNGAAQIV